MKSNFYVSAIYTSPPITMGGNTKILIEVINNLSNVFNFIIFTTEPKTFIKNLKHASRVTIIPIDYPFRKFSYLDHYKEVKYIQQAYELYFSKHTISNNDYFYSCSDFAPDVLPIGALKEKHRFIWIASLFLFIPNPWENLLQNYKFPFFKYVIYYCYQQFIIQNILRKSDLFLITNDYDKKYFPEKLRNNVHAIYGGVNLEQIEEASKKKNHGIKYDAVFCSRLHPQKGISQLLEIWQSVVREYPQVKIGIIGNGEEKYEQFLKNKAILLGISDTIEWLGYINNTEKYKIYLQSRMLLHSTVYDNNGMVAAEALATGLPVVMYDLSPLKDVYQAGCVKVPVGNKIKFSELIIRLLRDKKFYNQHKPDVYQKKVIQNYWAWEHRVNLLHQFIMTHAAQSK